jgi:hypothetical protein
VTSPKIVTRAFARPPQPFIFTVRLARVLYAKFLVCIASGVRQKIGWPSASVAKSTVDANGYPVLSEAMIDIGVELKGRQASEAELKGVVGG